MWVTKNNGILVLGCGGVGAELSGLLYKLICTDQLDPNKVDITVMDNDVVEMRNIKSCQNFRKEDITHHKAKVIGTRYNFNYEVKRAEKEADLEPYDIIMICVDNPKTRLLAYEHCIRNNKFFIDGRAEGKSTALLTKGRGIDRLKKTVDSKREPASCQLKHRFEKGLIDLGHLIIAPQMAQCLLNYLRGEKSPTFISNTF